jgi:hypothetical protein
MRVRANAGASSFRREKTLWECLTQAEEQIAALQDNEDESSATPQESAAHDRKERVEAALLSPFDRGFRSRGSYQSRGRGIAL